MPPPTAPDPAAVRRLVDRLRERCDRRRHHVGEPLRDLLETAAATIERQADTIAAQRCDCAEATLTARIEGARETC
jgi:hypothetical protein